MTVSALTGTGLSEAWAAIETLAAGRRTSGIWDDRRQAQAVAAFRALVEQGLLSLAREGSRADRWDDLAQAVATGSLAPEVAADRMLASVRGSAGPGGVQGPGS